MCGAFDPDCSDPNATVFNCPSDQHACNADAMCVVPNWTCNPAYYNESANYCDCSCGIPDPDCAAFYPSDVYGCDDRRHTCSPEGACVRAPSPPPNPPSPPPVSEHALCAERKQPGCLDNCAPVTDCQDYTCAQLISDFDYTLDELLSSYNCSCACTARAPGQALRVEMTLLEKMDTFLKRRTNFRTTLAHFLNLLVDELYITGLQGTESVVVELTVFESDASGADVVGSLNGASQAELSFAAGANVSSIQVEQIRGPAPPPPRLPPSSPPSTPPSLPPVSPPPSPLPKPPPSPPPSPLPKPATEPAAGAAAEPSSETSL